MPHRQYLGAALVAAFIGAVTLALALAPDIDVAPDDDDADEYIAEVPTDVEASSPSSVTSVPTDEGIDRDLVWIADLDAEGGRFEAVLDLGTEAEPGARLCVDMIVPSAGDPGELAAAVRIGAVGEVGDIVVDLGQPDNLSGDGTGPAWADRCVAVDDDLVTSLEVSTDAYHVVVFEGDQSNEAARGQLTLATLFDRELDEGP